MSSDRHEQDQRTRDWIDYWFDKALIVAGAVLVGYMAHAHYADPVLAAIALTCLGKGSLSEAARAISRRTEDAK